MNLYSHYYYYLVDYGIYAKNYKIFRRIVCPIENISAYSGHYFLLLEDKIATKHLLWYWYF